MTINFISAIKAAFTTGSLAGVGKLLFNFSNNSDFKSETRKDISDINTHLENTDRQVVEMRQAILKLQTENHGFYKEVRDGFAGVKTEMGAHESRDQDRHDELFGMQNKMLDILLKK